MLKMLTDEKVADVLSYCENGVFGLFSAAGIRVYGTDSRFIRSWYGENDAGEINCVLSIIGKTLRAAFSEGADFMSAYELARLSGASEFLFNARFAKHFKFADFLGGDIMSASVAPENGLAVKIAETENLAALFSVLFENGEGEFDRWYTETSHRIRHGIGTVFALYEDGKPVSSASIIAESKAFGFIAEVATLCAYRCRGFAGACVSAAVNSLAEKGKTAVLLSTDAYSSAFYERLGFTRCGEWRKIIFEG